ncbi:MAG: glycine zipper 2TM domain-containing protein [Rhodocyclaceae bacterium]|nr:glycine zipper 2TM domain-containing protein [Rhodocyclaceae bacterium]
MKAPQVLHHQPTKAPPRLLYPSLIVAAVTVTLFGLVGIAGITGHLPSALAGADAEQKVEATQKKLAACYECGVIESVRAVEVKGSGSGMGAVIGGVAGALLGNGMGQGNGRTAMTLVGGGAGAYAGNEVEKNSNRHLIWQTRVRMDSGAVRTVSTRTQPDLGVGAKVKLIDGQLVPQA